jgi:isopentenyl diphosphate isomerase/L-lactate dehydrogenase-like FMN-dependent dehydrogenase
MLGRAPLHGVAAAGEAGALRALQIYHDEIDRVLALVGCTRLNQLTREHVDMRGALGGVAS